MNNNESSLPEVSMNVDKMLSSLGGEKTNSSSVFNIDSLAKPSSTFFSEPEKDIPVISKKSKILIVFKKIVVLLLTFLFLFLLYGFLSIQYPIETKVYRDKISGTFLSILHSIKKNTSFVTFKENTYFSGESELKVYDQEEFPLTNAIHNKQKAILPTGDVFNDTFSDIDQASVSAENSSSYDIMIKKEKIRENLIIIKEAADRYLLEGSSVSLNMSIAKAVSKKSESLSSDLENNFVEMSFLEKELFQLELLLKKINAKI